MTTYFAAPDGHGEPTLWVRLDPPHDPVPVVRRRDFGFMGSEWDEIVARVVAGNLTAQQRWALDRAAQG